MAARVLITDDDAVQRRLVENMVQKCGYEALVAESGDAAVAMLTAPDGPDIDAVVLDLVMPGLDGMGVLAKMREAGLNIPVIVQTAHGGIDNVVSAMRAGAQDFVVKPVGFERLQVSLRNALNTSALQGELQRIKHSREGKLTFADIVTRSEAMAGVLRTAQKAAASSIPVLIEGESGSVVTQAEIDAVQPPDVVLYSFFGDSSALAMAAAFRSWVEHAAARVAPGLLGAIEYPFHCFQEPRQGGLAIGGDMALTNASAGMDPLVTGVDDLFQIGIGNHALG